MTSTDGQARIDAYLKRLRAGLRGLPAEEAREIVEELRGHILDKAAGDRPAGATLPVAAIEDALAALGSPEDLAREYATDHVMARAEVTRSPMRVLASLYQWATLSVVGFFALAGTVMGYFIGASFLVCGLLKPFHPRSAGLWLIPGAGQDYVLSLRMGFSGIPAEGRELLGWWLLPLGIAGGGGMVLLTTSAALWCVRQYRQQHAAKRGWV
jgi:hypothetical protein